MAARAGLALGLGLVAGGCSPDASSDKCEHGDSSACVRARSLAQGRCRRGDTRACYVLGDLCAAGKGGPTDLARARNLVGRACAGGNAELCKQVGRELLGR